MARRRLVHARVQAQREAKRKHIAFEQAVRAAEKAQKDYERALQADQKERARLYTESRVAQVNLQNEQLNQSIAQLSSVLIEALSVESFIHLQTLKQAPEYPNFNPGQLGVVEPPPVLQMYLPPELTGIQKLVPGAKEKHNREVAKASDLYRSHAATHAAREQARQRSLAEAKALFDRHVVEVYQKIAVQHAEIDNFEQELIAGSPSAVVNYCNYSGLLRTCRRAKNDVK